MRRDDVPEQDVVDELQLGEHPLDDRRRRLGRTRPGELPLGRERDTGDARAAIPRSLADEEERRVRTRCQVRRQPLP
jgi:hypothetical protein